MPIVKLYIKLIIEIISIFSIQKCHDEYLKLKIYP